MYAVFLIFLCRYTYVHSISSSQYNHFFIGGAISKYLLHLLTQLPVRKPNNKIECSSFFIKRY